MMSQQGHSHSGPQRGSQHGSAGHRPRTDLLSDRTKDQTPGGSTHHDGRVKNPVPKKFWGQAKSEDGNFAILNLGLNKRQKGERDAAAKRTSEGTVAVAETARRINSQYARKDRVYFTEPQHTRVSSISREPSVAPMAPMSPTRTVSPVQAAQSRPVDAPPRFNYHPTSNLREGIHALEQEMRQQRQLSLSPMRKQGEALPSNSIAHRPLPNVHGAVPSSEPPIHARPSEPRDIVLAETHTSKIPPHTVKVEQARLLTVLRSIEPSEVVNKLCKGLAYFGGIPGAPPPPDGEFPQSSQGNGSGSGLVAWMAELFKEEDTPFGPIYTHAPPAQSSSPQELVRTFPSPEPPTQPTPSARPRPLPTQQSTENSTAEPPSSTIQQTPPVKRGRGRPFGSKSKVFRKDKGIPRGPMKKKGETHSAQEGGEGDGGASDPQSSQTHLPEPSSDPAVAEAAPISTGVVGGAEIASRTSHDTAPSSSQALGRKRTFIDLSTEPQGPIVTPPRRPDQTAESRASNKTPLSPKKARVSTPSPRPKEESLFVP